MNEKTVTAILWTLVAVCLVGYLDALYSLRLNERDWSRVETPAVTTTTQWRGGGK